LHLALVYVFGPRIEIILGRREYYAANRAKASLCSFGLSANQSAVFFSHTKLASVTRHAVVLFSHSKSAPATRHSQANIVVS